MIRDVHAHYIPQVLSDFMGERFQPRAGQATKTGIARHPVSDSPVDISGRLGSDYPVLQDYESYSETFAYIERLGLPRATTDKILHHNAQMLLGLPH